MKKTVPIRKNYEFMRAYKRGKFFVGKFLILYVVSNNMKVNRLGITTSKKVGKSVIRNRIRRLIKESYRLYEDFIIEGYDLVFVARNFNEMPEFVQINREMKFLLKRMEVFDQEKWNCSKDC